jgi:acetyl-CoA carboxylase biotin carboxyl carrier protein
MGHDDSDLRRIEELIAIMKKNDLVEIEVKHGDDKIHLKRSQPQQPTVTAVPMVAGGVQGQNAGAGLVSAQPEPGDDLVEIKSPLVGTFYVKPSPDSEPYVDLNSQVDPGTVVCIVEAMMVMNEIKPEISGTIVEILVENGQAVEYGQILFRVKPD